MAGERDTIELTHSHCARGFLALKARRTALAQSRVTFSVTIVEKNLIPFLRLSSTSTSDERARNQGRAFGIDLLLISFFLISPSLSPLSSFVPFSPRLEKAFVCLRVNSVKTIYAGRQNGGHSLARSTLDERSSECS